MTQAIQVIDGGQSIMREMRWGVRVKATGAFVAAFKWGADANLYIEALITDPSLVEIVKISGVQK